MPHMLAQEHMGYVDALRYGTARNQATIAAALSAIGSTPTTLVLTFAGDGVWTLSSSFTSPVNVQIFIPPGVTVFRPAGVVWTIEGTIIAPYYAWETGPGAIVRGVGASMEISTPRASQLHVITTSNEPGLVVRNTATTGFVTLRSDTGSGFPGINIGRGVYAPPGGPDANGWTINVNNDVPGALFFGRPGFSPNVAMTSVGTWLGNGAGYTVPTFLVQAQTNQCAMPGGGPWLSWSDERMKELEGVFTDGLETVLALPDPVVYTYNGKGGMTVDHKEYVGMIAQQVLPVAPYMIGSYEDKLEPTDPDPTTIYTMQNGALVYILLNAIRELAARVEALETLAGTRVPALEDIAHTHTGTGNAGGVVDFVPQARASAAAAPERPARRKRAHR